MAASAQASYNDLSGETTPRAAGMIANTWAGTGKFGALFSLAYAKRKLLDAGSSTVRWARYVLLARLRRPAERCGAAGDGEPGLGRQQRRLPPRVSALRPL